MNNKLFIVLFFTFCFATPVFATDQININTATLEQLDQLTGIGPVYAQRIIDARPFSSVDDLDKVKGIGPATLQKIKDQGLACVNCETTLSTTETPATVVIPAEAGIQTPILTITYPTGVIINEILPNPEGADETEEWLELYNQNNFDIDLSGWKITDTNGTPTDFVFPKDSKILANNFLVLKRPDTKIMLNNDADGLNFLAPDDKIIDSASFTKAPLGQSYNKTNSDWAWSTKLTPGAVNIILAVQKALPTTKKSVKNEIVEAGLADISQNIDINQENNTNNNPWLLFYVVLAITIILASVILFIKIKFTKQNVRT